MAGPAAGEAGAALARHLSAVLVDLEPALLGLYWPQRFEFNAAALLAADPNRAKLPTFALALPFAQRTPRQLHYRAWDGAPPGALDDCGIATSAGAPVLPDVVLVPCVGYTRDGYRLGYGGGYFDRWLAQQPDVTAIGVAWSGSEIEHDTLAPQAHDIALALVVTERGVA